MAALAWATERFSDAIVVVDPDQTTRHSTCLVSSAAIDAGVASTSMEDDSVAPVPNPRVQQHLFELIRPASEEAVREKALTSLLAEIEKDGMCCPSL